MILTKQITLFKHNKLYSGELKVEKNSIILNSSLSSILKEGDFYFYILKEIRKQLDSENIFFLINASRKNVYPSGMTLGTEMAYIHTLGKQASLNDLVNIFDDFLDLSQISTVKEQDEFHKDWIKSLQQL